MIWGGFCGSIKSELVIIPGKATLDSAAYATAVMEPHLVPLWNKYCKERRWAVVMEDGAPGHRRHSKKMPR